MITENKRIHRNFLYYGEFLNFASECEKNLGGQEHRHLQPQGKLV